MIESGNQQFEINIDEIYKKNHQEEAPQEE